MGRTGRALVTLGVVSALALPASLSFGGPAATAAGGPTHTLVVGGVGVATYPAFDPAVERYAVTTTGATAGSITVTATTSDPAGTVRVDGRPVTGPTTVDGLSEGDEVSVLIDDAGGHEVHSLVYLPTGFPTLAVTTKRAGIAPGDVGLTLNRFAGDGSPTFDTIVDDNGVPRWVREEPAAGDLDLKRQPDGSLTVMKPTTSPGRSGNVLVTLDDHYRETGRLETTGLVNTDGHDSWLFPDGRRILIAYEPNASTHRTDAVIQVVDPQGVVTFQWDSAGLVADSLYGGQDGTDYAHINSVWPMPDGDIVASFRHLSAVLRIATTAHDGYESGDIVWKLGGRDSDFTFPDPGFEGRPCAQHTASDVVGPDGKEHVLLFDDGSNGLTGTVCVDPADPSGAAVLRPQTRATEYVLDPVAHTATVVWNYQVPGQSSAFAGSTQRLANGDTLIGWAATPYAIATEVAADGTVQWQLEDTAATKRYVSYRAARFPAPDAIAPELTVTTPAEDATYGLGTEVQADYACTDRGGSSLTACGGDRVPGALLDTGRPGRTTVTLSAVDGAGNHATVVRHYRTAGPFQPDAMVRAGSRWVGSDVYGTWRSQRTTSRLGRAGASRATLVRLVNRGTSSDRLRLDGTAGTAAFGVRYVVGGRDRTRAVLAGTYRSPVLGPGQAITVRLTVTRLRAAHVGSRHAFRLGVRSAHDTTARDAAGVLARATRTP